MTIRAVVFDFGGVLFDWSPQHLYRQLIADDDERQWFLDNICTQAWNTEQDAGRTLAEATRSLVAQYPQHETLITAYYDRWHEMLARGRCPRAWPFSRRCIRPTCRCSGSPIGRPRRSPMRGPTTRSCSVFAISWSPAS